VILLKLQNVVFAKITVAQCDYAKTHSQSKHALTLHELFEVYKKKSFVKQDRRITNIQGLVTCGQKPVS
jgi:hypothetical protein